MVVVEEVVVVEVVVVVNVEVEVVVVEPLLDNGTKGT